MDQVPYDGMKSLCYKKSYYLFVCVTSDIVILTIFQNMDSFYRTIKVLVSAHLIHVLFNTFLFVCATLS
jgi:hypothetical protein